MNKIRLNQYFNLKEFECPCCHRVMLSEILLQKLFQLRYLLGKPINIDSGYRCVEDNKAIGGSIGSYHMKGMAADISVEGMPLYDLYQEALEFNFTGIGFYEKKNFLHLDVRPGKLFEWKEWSLIDFEYFLKLIANNGFPLVLSVYLVLKLEFFIGEIIKNQKEFSKNITTEIKEIKFAINELRVEFAKKWYNPLNISFIDPLKNRF